MTLKTLSDRILSNFSSVKIKKISVRIPKLKVRKRKISVQKKNDEIPVSSIVNILIKTAVEKAKKEKKEKSPEEGKSYTILKEEKEQKLSGYGATSKGYGAMPQSSYVDYGKLFSYLGQFKSQSPYENMAEHVGILNKTTESGSFVLADRDVIDKTAKYDKYMKNPAMAMPTIALSLVPIVGLSSGEWEEIKMFMKLDPVMYNLKTLTS